MDSVILDIEKIWKKDFLDSVWGLWYILILEMNNIDFSLGYFFEKMRVFIIFWF